jgi:hypothetical protein
MSGFEQNDYDYSPVEDVREDPAPAEADENFSYGDEEDVISVEETPEENLDDGMGEEEVTEGTEEPADNTISEELYQRAIAAGLKDHIIEAFESVDELESFLAPVGEQEPMESQEPIPEEFSSLEFPEELAPNWDNEFMDEEVLERMSERDKFVSEKFQEQNLMLERLRSELETREIDDLFAGSPEAYHEQLGGTGSLMKLHTSKAKDAIEARNNVVNTLKALQARNPDASQEALFHKALRAEFPDAEHKAQQQQLAKSLKTQKGRTLGRVKRGNPQRNLTPEQSAHLRIQQFMERRGGQL